MSRDTHTKYKFAPLEQEGAFFFPTDDGCHYTVEINEAGYKLWMSERLSTDDKVFELAFDRSCDDADPGFDEAISNTLIYIFGSNMASKGETCVYYHICEPDRGEARARLYDSWFEDLSIYIPDFEMIDFECRDAESEEKYFTSLFIHKNHPEKDLIISEFEEAINKGINGNFF